jgi:hypothetical protein
MHGNAFKWTPEIEAEIFSRLASGETVMQICGPDRDDFLPGERTFYKRLSEDAEFAQEYARAREAQAHHEADEIKGLADAATPENVHVARLQIDARKWRASKMAPKVYGDKQAVLHGNDPDNPLPASIAVTFVRPDGGA